MPNFTATFNVKRPTGLGATARSGTEVLRYLLNAVESAIAGTNQSDGVMFNVTDIESLGAIAYAGQAIGAIIIGAVVDTAGATVCGTVLSTAVGADGAATMTLLAAAIRASTAVNRKVTATNISMRVTLATVTAGQFIVIGGVKFIAVNGTPVNFGEFDMSGNDTADALSLVTAINRHPQTALRYRALSVAGLVHVFPTTSRTLTPTQDKWAAITNPGSFTTFTINAPNPVAGDSCAVLAIVPGDIGNECRLSTPTGTNVTVATNGTAGFLGLGTGGGSSPTFNLP
jgi:hypothetical protein